MKKEIKGASRIFLGINKDTNERIYITKPKWDCEWYWSFGYLGNENHHYHLDGYATKEHYFKLEDGSFKFITEKRNKHMHDCLLEDYKLTSKIKDNLWEFCELSRTIYTLKEAAEVLGRGGSHYTTNSCKDLIINKDEVTRLNEKVIPELCQKLWDLITPE